MSDILAGVCRDNVPAWVVPVLGYQCEIASHARQRLRLRINGQVEMDPGDVLSQRARIHVVAIAQHDDAEPPLGEAQQLTAIAGPAAAVADGGEAVAL